jgi:hypothetical protein
MKDSHFKPSGSVQPSAPGASADLAAYLSAR